MPRRRAELDVIGFLARFAPLIFLIVLMAVFAIAEPRFLHAAQPVQHLRRCRSTACSPSA